MADPQSQSARRIRALQAEIEELRRQVAALAASELELRRQKETLQTIFDHLPLMINVIDKDGRVEAVNRQWERTLGWTAQEALNKDLRSLCSECYPDVEESNRVLSHISEGKAEWANFRTRAKDGSIVETSWTNVHLSDGRIIGIGQDNSERKQAERALLDSEERFRQVAENIGVVFWMFDPAAQEYLYVSPAYERVWGRTCENLYADPLTALEAVAPEDRQRVAGAYLDQVRQRQIALDQEYRIVCPDGEIRWIAERSFAILDRNGEIYRFVGIAEDISERKWGDDVLRRTQTYLADAESLSHIGTWVYSAAVGEIIFWSDEHFRIFGYDPAGGIPSVEAIVSRISPEDLHYLATFEAAIAEKKDFESEFRIQMTDGSFKHILSIGHPVVNAAGELVEFTGMAMDITARKIVEQELQTSFSQARALATQLERVREEEDRRIARELHDELGSSLTGIKWDLEELEGLLSGAREQLDIDALRAKIRGMENLVNTTIQSIKRISSELRPAILDDLDIAESLEWLAQTFQDRTGIFCRSEGGSAGRHLNREQSTAVFRIVQEALTNIIRHAQATSVEITMDEIAHNFELKIVDNGIGIDVRQMSKPLSLGILGMRERAHLLGGYLKIVGEPGNGTTVTLHIPLTNGEPQNRQFRSARGSRG